MLSGGLNTSGLWPPFRAYVEQLLMPYAAYYGLSGTVVSGYRSLQEQADLYAKGRTPYEVAHQVSKQGRNGSVTDAPPGRSAHNYGLAIDVEGVDQSQLVALAAALGFGTVSWDPAHIEWPRWQSLLR